MGRVQRRTKVDALGRIALVEENPNLQDGKPMLTTSYTYDARGNLRSVSQSGRNRTFVYDPLGRLTLALNPEAASALSYSYDDAGNLTQKSDGRTTITWDPYDNLNRPTRKVYSDGTTPTVTYGYDAGSNGKGRLTAVSAGGVSATAYTYNELGLPSFSVQTTNGVNYPFTYVYKKGGVLETMIYPSGRQVSYCYDAAGRVNAVKNGSTVSGDVYAAGVQYAPHNGISGMVLGNGVVETAVYNGRLQATQIQAVLGTALLTINNNYGGSNNNGNLLSQSVTLPGASITQNYGYDPCNRLRTMTETGLPCSQTYVYDAVGNRALLSGSCVRDATLTPQTPSDQTVPFDVANHWAGAGYDSMNGNMLSVSGHSYAYDGENRLKQSAAPLGTATYHYDGEGRRVLKVAGTATVYVYDALGRLAAEYGGAGDSSGRQYLTADHLGSTRLVTNSAGVVKRYDYLPYGEQLYAGDGLRTAGMGYVGNPAADPQTKRFTGKERDQETGLDYFGARYFSAAQGRFTTPDALIMKKEWLNDPQRWNHYAYVRNNPLRYIDPNGEDLTVVYSTAGLSDENEEWFKKNRAAIFAVIQAKYKAAGVDKVHFKERSSLTKEQQAQLGQIPAQDKRGETFVHGLVQLNFLNNRSEIATAGSPYTTAYGFTNSGRAEIFLDNIGDGGCGRTCAAANVIAHEFGHALGLEDRGHGFDPLGVTQGLSLPEFGREVIMGRPRDVMYSGDPSKAPFGYNTNVDKNVRILQEVNRVKPIYP